MGARHAAEYRNWYWQRKRKGSSDKGIELSASNQFYPTKLDMISDRPASDSGGNFGRLARAGVIEEYISQIFEEKLAEIQLAAWQRFLSIFTEGVTDKDIDAALQKIADSIASTVDDPNALQKLAEKFREIANLIEEE